jgi:thymidylate synthase
MNNLDKQYTELLQDILENGTKRQDRTGTGTISVFGRQIRHKMSEGFPLVTTKKMAFKTMVTELLWFLKGDTSIKYLLENDCNIWTGDAYKNYVTKIQSDYSTDNTKYKDGFDCNYKPVTGTVLEDIGSKYSLYAEPFTMDEFINKIKTDDEFAKVWGEIGPVYGAQWRSWKTEVAIPTTLKLDDEPLFFRGTKYIDQIANLINDLKTNPDSRRLLVSVWNPSELNQMVLPPCHYGFQVYTRELTASERITYKNTKQINLLDSNELYDFIKNNVTMDLDNQVHKECDESNIPTRAISLMYNVRSQDVGLGWSFNVSSYALLLIMIAKQVNMVPDELIMNMGDCHIYLNHIDGLKEQIGRDLTDEERYNIWFDNNYETGMERYFDPNNLPNFDDDYYVPTPKRTREPYHLPTLKLSDRVVNDISEYTIDDIILENYKCHPAIKLPLSN